MLLKYHSFKELPLPVVGRPWGSFDVSGMGVHSSKCGSDMNQERYENLEKVGIL